MCVCVCMSLWSVKLVMTGKSVIAYTLIHIVVIVSKKKKQIFSNGTAQLL